MFETVLSGGVQMHLCSSRGRLAGNDIEPRAIVTMTTCSLQPNGWRELKTPRVTGAFRDDITFDTAGRPLIRRQPAILSRPFLHWPGNSPRVASKRGRAGVSSFCSHSNTPMAPFLLSKSPRTARYLRFLILPKSCMGSSRGIPQPDAIAHFRRPGGPATGSFPCRMRTAPGANIFI